MRESSLSTYLDIARASSERMLADAARPPLSRELTVKEAAAVLSAIYRGCTTVEDLPSACKLSSGRMLIALGWLIDQKLVIADEQLSLSLARETRLKLVA